jgi:mRNA interferase ChpB
VQPVIQGGEFARGKGFAVTLSGFGTNAQSVVLCNQPRVLDLQSRRATFVGKAPPVVVDEVIAKLLTLPE